MLSRVADSLYWMSRYLERTEHTARLMDLNLVLMLDQSPQFAALRWQRVFDALKLDPPPDVDARAITQMLAFDRGNRGSIFSSLVGARDNARHVREQISSEMWMQINQLYLHVQRTGLDDIWDAEPNAFLAEIKQGCHLFQGITDATLTHDEGWCFIQLGRWIERAGATAALLEAHIGGFVPSAEQPPEVTDYLDWVGVLKSCTAFEAYCQVYTADLQPARIAEFLMLNPDVPRSIRFSVERIRRSLEAIAAATGTRHGGPALRIAGRLQADLSFAGIDEIIADDMQAFLVGIQRRCGELHREIDRLYFAPPLETVLAS